MKLAELMSETQFQDYVPTAAELDQQIAETEKSMQMAKSMGKAPMVAKYQQRLEQLQAKRAQLSESASDYSARLGKMSDAKLQQELDDLEQMTGSSGAAEHLDDLRDDIKAVKAEIARRSN